MILKIWKLNNSPVTEPKDLAHLMTISASGRKFEPNPSVSHLQPVCQ
jgi:hypothetical protein